MSERRKRDEEKTYASLTLSCIFDEPSTSLIFILFLLPIKSSHEEGLLLDSVVDKKLTEG